MAQEEIHVGDIGTVFELTIQDDNSAIDVSGATTKNIVFKKADGTTVTQAASFTSDGTDGKIRYAVVADDLDVAGEWSIQGHIVIPAGTWYTDIGFFTLHDNL